MEDEFSGEKSCIRQEPTAADYEPQVRVFRSLAAIAFMYGTVGVVMLPYGLLRFHQGAIPGDFRVKILDGPLSSTSVQALWLVFASVTGTGLSLALMIGGLGGVQLKSWSRPVLTRWAIASILFGAGGSLFYFQWLLPPWREQLAQVRGVDDTFINLGGWMIGSLLAIAMLIVICRPAVRNALERSGKIIEPASSDSQA